MRVTLYYSPIKMQERMCEKYGSFQIKHSYFTSNIHSRHSTCETSISPWNNWIIESGAAAVSAAALPFKVSRLPRRMNYAARRRIIQGDLVTRKYTWKCIPKCLFFVQTRGVNVPMPQIWLQKWNVQTSMCARNRELETCPCTFGCIFEGTFRCTVEYKQGTDLIDLRLTWRIGFLGDLGFLEISLRIFGEFLRSFGGIGSLLED